MESFINALAQRGAVSWLGTIVDVVAHGRILSALAKQILQRYTIVIALQRSWIRPVGYRRKMISAASISVMRCARNLPGRR
jgi:hypothetical protein